MYSSAPSYPYINYPYFYVTEVHRDEVTNVLSITAYDRLYWGSSHTTSEINKEDATIGELALECCRVLDLNEVSLIQRDVLTDAPFMRKYALNGQAQNQNITNYANIDGTETIRELLDDIAEATQTIYFIEKEKLVFSRISENITPVYEINKDRYFELDINTNRRISAVTKTNELGDAVTASTGVSGTTVYIKNNVLWDNQNDIAELVDDAIGRVGGFTMCQFECKWRGNPLLTIGDNVSLTKKDGSSISAFYINSTVNYDGALEEKTEWNYSESDEETANNPTNLGEVLHQTSAKVDKVNKNIEMVVKETSSNSSTISSINSNLNGIATSVSKITEQLDGENGINSQLTSIQKSVEQIVTEEKIDYKIVEAITNGVTKVETETGFVFDATGLTIAKSGTPVTTTITEDGMIVKRDNKEMLVANEKGVEAVNLNASTYLIIGKNSRFEDYGSKRTGCFWIGG